MRPSIRLGRIFGIDIGLHYSWFLIALLIVFLAIYVCCLAIQTSTIRLAFGMARDEKLPVSRLYNKVNPTLHTPVWTCVVVGALSAVPFLYFAGAGLVAISATGMIYFSYLLGNIAILIARRKGWPTEGAPFKLGGWGMVVNVLALVWGGSMLLNFMWPRAASNPPVSALPNIPNLGPLSNVPIFEATIAVILVVGAIYYLVAQRGMRRRVGPAALPTYNDHHMAVKIRVPGALRQLTRGAAIVEVDADDVSQALDELNEKYPGFRERLYDDKGELRQFINIYRNDEDIRFGSGLKTPLKDSDDLSIVPAVAGG